MSTAPVDEVGAALDLLARYGPLPAGAEVEVDLSLARGLRYYTGLVFEIYVDSDEGPLQVCGGGRYDDLVRALGGREAVPACGFSYGLERVDLAWVTASRPASARRGAGRRRHAGRSPDGARRGARRCARSTDLARRTGRAAARGQSGACATPIGRGIDLVAIVGERERAEAPSCCATCAPARRRAFRWRRSRRRRAREPSA